MPRSASSKRGHRVQERRALGVLTRSGARVDGDAPVRLGATSWSISWASRLGSSRCTRGTPIGLSTWAGGWSTSAPRTARPTPRIACGGGATATTPPSVRSSGSTTPWGRCTSRAGRWWSLPTPPWRCGRSTWPMSISPTATSSGRLGAIGRQPVLDAARMACLSRGITEDELAERPSLYVVTNSNSPRRLDEELLEGAMTAAELG